MKGVTKNNCWDEVESTQRVREDVRPDHNLPPAERRRRGFFYHLNWRFPSLDSWDLIRAAHSTQSAIDLYVARDPLSRRLRRNTRDESGTQQPKAEEQAEDKGVYSGSTPFYGKTFSVAKGGTY
ncbi:T0156445 isoform 6 [Pongo abelii]|uniref:T0156445 isoform 6 n=1 Tax=Pongo abelii TaxID=9601 RepID=A0A2J8SD58_PONAB|nr:T0156445 isoform 6 [Pongo abelii]